MAPHGSHEEKPVGGISLKIELHLFARAMLLIIFLKLISNSAAIQEEDLTSAAGHKIPSDFTPNFVGPIRNVTVAAGREAILSCSVTDLGRYKVGWMKADDQTILSLHTRVITHNPRISVTHDDHLRTWQLHIRQLKESDRGCYMCQINTNSMKKQLGCVDVQVPPDIDDAETSGDVTVSEGDNVTLGCKATGHPSPRILWRREDGDHILLHVKPQETQRVDTFSGSHLNLVNVERRQMGAYLCIASNDVPPAVSKRITLNINFSPSVQVQKALVGAPFGANAKLKCDVQAFPHSNNHWIKEHDEDIINGMKYTVQEKHFDFRVVMTLTIHNVTKNDIASYKCIASNSMGKSEGTIRLYEIKIVTTTTTTTTTSTETYKEMTTSVQSVETPLSSNTIDTLGMIEEDPMENWLFPSVAPAPLELETHSSTVSCVFHLNATLLLLAGLTHTFR